MTRPKLLFSILTLCMGLMSCLPASAASNWPQFRGPDGSGHSNEKALPVKWDAGDIAWRTELAGVGQSSPCIWGERIYVTAAGRGANGGVERRVLCLDRNDGKILWQKVAATGEGESIHKMNSFATPTCATDGERVVAFFGRGGIHCYTMDGVKLWAHNLLGTFPGPWGTGASPVIYGDTVIQNCDAEGNAYLVAFDKRTGKEVWRGERRDKPRGGWSTPIVIDTGKRQELVLNGEFGVRGYDPKTGAAHWFCKSFNGRGTPTPAWGDGLLYVVNGKPGDVYAVRPNGSGDVTDSHMAWHTPRRGGRDLPSPMLVANYLVVVSMNGIGTCYDAPSGKTIWETRLGGNYSGSPIAAAGLVYLQNEAGETLVIRPGDKPEIVSRNPIGAKDDEIFRNSPAPSEGQIFTRSNRALYCIGKRAAG